MSFEIQSVQTTSPTHHLKNVVKANWPHYKRYITKNLTLNRNIININDIDDEITKLTITIKTASDRYISNKEIQNIETDYDEDCRIIFRCMDINNLGYAAEIVFAIVSVTYKSLYPLLQNMAWY